METDLIERGFLELSFSSENRKETEFGVREIEGKFWGKRRREGHCEVIAENAIEESSKLVLSSFLFFFFLFLKIDPKNV